MKKITKLGMAAAVLFCVVGLGSHTQAAMAAEETTIENGISIGPGDFYSYLPES